MSIVCLWIKLRQHHIGEFTEFTGYDRCLQLQWPSLLHRLINVPALISTIRSGEICSAPDHDCVHCSTTWWRSHEVTHNGAALKRKQLSVFTYDTAPVITYSLTFGVFVLPNPNRVGFSETVHSVRESESGFETKLNVEPGYQTIRLASESESGFTVNLSCFWSTLYWHFYYLWFKKSYLWGVSQWVCL